MTRINGRTMVLAAVLVAAGLAAAGKPTAPATATAPATHSAPANDEQRVNRWIADLSSPNGMTRTTATKALFDLGQDALEPLKAAGAKQISPFGTIGSTRLDMVYSLLDGLRPNPPQRRAGYLTNGFGLTIEEGCTRDVLVKMGARHGFTVAGEPNPKTRPSCYVTLSPGRSLPDVLKAVLSAEPMVVTVNLNYFET